MARSGMLLTILATLLVSGCGSLNKPLPYPIADALAVPEYKQDLKGMKFYFGNQSHPPVAKSFGVKTTAQRASKDNEGNEDCARAFASALIRLRSVALREGGDAVINIKSNWKHNEVSSETYYQCATGALMSGVALKGEVVKLK